jgi:hypothetical protein
MKKRILIGVALFICFFLLSARAAISQGVCEGDFDCDADCDGSDASVFKADFGRNWFNTPCPACDNNPCPSGMVDCGGICVDPMKDREYCGADEGCLNGAVCGDGEICINGVCELNCPPALMKCDGVCVDASTDENNCGSCDHLCQPDEMCVAGICETRLLAYAPVPKTGQTVCYDDYLAIIPCPEAGEPYYGQDGQYQKGVAWPEPRFTDNENGTVTDNLTGLIWLKDANCFGLINWSAALSGCYQLADGVCGLTDNSVLGDWRLPNRKELFSLTSAGEINPALATGHPFINVQNFYYWSSTTDANSIGNAWSVSLVNGRINIGAKQSYTYYAWPVRDGHTIVTTTIPTSTTTTIPSPVPKSWMTLSYRTGDDGYYQTGLGWETPRFTDNGDGTVNDNFTGLMWIQNIGQFGRIMWDAAVDTCYNLDYAGYQDWRLPNVKELFSLTDYSQKGPRLPADHPFTGYEGGHDWCWSSTTEFNSTANADVFSVGTGDVGAENKTTKLFKCWCVRGGQ